MLKRSLHGKDSNLVIRSDNGPQFTSYLFEDSCIELRLEHERIPYATPNKNAHIESFHRILEEECLSRYDFDSFAQAYKVVSEFMLSYNKVRIHSSIGYVAPEKYYKNAIAGTGLKQVIKL